MKIIKVTSDDSDYGAMTFEDTYEGSYYELWKEAMEKGEVVLTLPSPAEYLDDADEDMMDEFEPESVTITAYELNMDKEAFEFFAENFIDYDYSKCTNVFIVEE